MSISHHELVVKVEGRGLIIHHCSYPFTRLPGLLVQFCDSYRGILHHIWGSYTLALLVRTILWIIIWVFALVTTWRGPAKNSFPVMHDQSFTFEIKLQQEMSSFYCIHDWLRGEVKVKFLKFDKSEKYEKWIKLSECWMSHQHFSPIKCNTSNFLVGVEQTERKTNEGFRQAAWGMGGLPCLSTN